ncbi:MAG: serine/threonine protein kinase [Lachnospiraceae bacterium]|nr:serine/threonine protein kinase [Lachnospiraceae bacterium]
MKKPKVCLGCFTEWEGEKSKCPHCGWEYNQKEPTHLQWNVGDVLEKRYLVGKPVYVDKDMTLWRMYDNILGCPVWVLYGKKMAKENLCEIAKVLKNAVILSLKQLDKREVLIFSIEKHMVADEAVMSGFVTEIKKMIAGCESVVAKNTEVGQKSEAAKSAEAESKQEEAELTGKEQDNSRILSEGICLANRYKIRKGLGIGGFGITYLCEDMYLQRKVAVKEYFPEEWAERDETYVTVKKSAMLSAFQYGMLTFKKEIQITAKFIHTPHIVTVYDAFEDNDTVYMVMEYIEGISIGKELRQREYKPYTIAEMAEIILPLLDALEKIHEASIVHSDISPGNILRSQNGEIVLIDMGAAKYTVDSQPALSAAFLKIEYAAPEQYQTAREGISKGEGPWTDIYAVGATMYYLLTGHKPMDVISRLSSKKSDFTSPKKFKVKLSGKWMRLIHHAAALNKEERIRSASALQEEMQKLLS